MRATTILATCAILFGLSVAAQISKSEQTDTHGSSFPAILNISPMIACGMMVSSDIDTCRAGANIHLRNQTMSLALPQTVLPQAGRYYRMFAFH